MTMLISPSVASADVLNVSQEVKFIDKYFNSLHLDVEDGVAVNNISFGFKMCKGIIEMSTSEEISLHLEIINPLKFIDDVLDCNADIVFIQADCLKDPIHVIKEFRKKGIPTGVNLSNLDLERNILNDLVASSENILINTTHHDDRTQKCDLMMVDYAMSLAIRGKKIWIDGGITYEIYSKFKNSKIHSAIMGRAVFSDKEMALKRFVY